ncbi:MAG TPA: transposase [Ktedonobacteraceae bacterium]|nr:transposase [Ktedonobacteraceae bacterium]
MSRTLSQHTHLFSAISKESEEQAMQVIYPRCAGLDVHQKTVVVTAMVTQDDGTVQREQRAVSTMTADLLTLDDWLRQRQIDVIALESTGVYWRPVYPILEEDRTVILVNARHMKAVAFPENGPEGQRMDCRWARVTVYCKPALFPLVPSERFAS